MERRIGTGLLAAAALLLFASLGTTDLWAPDEPRYAQVAEELRAGGHGATGWALMHLNGEPYAQKPPLYFWLAALLGAPGGRVSELAARLPSAVSGWLCVALVLRWGSGLLGPASARTGAALLLTAFTFASTARRAQLDVMLCLFETLALAAFWRIDRRPGVRRRDLAALHGALGLAVLTKGPVGLIVPALVMLAALAWEGRARDFARLLRPWALALSIGPGLLWLAAAASAAPAGFLDEAVLDNLLGRALLGTAHDRPIYYYLYQFPLNFLPWTLLWPFVAWAGARRVFAPGGDAERARVWRFLLAWVAASFAFFSLSAGKRGLYLMPAFPAAALLCADATRAFLCERGFPAWLSRALLAVAIGLAAAGLAAPAAIPRLYDVEIPREPGLAMAAILAASVLVWNSGRRFRTTAARAALVVACVLSVEAVVFTLLLPALDGEKSPRPVARAAAELTGPDEPVGVVGRRSLVGGLRYYGGRRVAVLDDPGDVPRFVAEGGRVLVVTQRRLEQVRADAVIEIRARARRGHRALYVVSAEPARGSVDP